MKEVTEGKHEEGKENTYDDNVFSEEKHEDGYYSGRKNTDDLEYVAEEEHEEVYDDITQKETTM